MTTARFMHLAADVHVNPAHVTCVQPSVTQEGWSDVGLGASVVRVHMSPAAVLAKLTESETS